MSVYRVSIRTYVSERESIRQQCEQGWMWALSLSLSIFWVGFSYSLLRESRSERELTQSVCTWVCVEIEREGIYKYISPIIFLLTVGICWFLTLTLVGLRLFFPFWAVFFWSFFFLISSTNSHVYVLTLCVCINVCRARNMFKQHLKIWCSATSICLYMSSPSTIMWEFYKMYRLTHGLLF